MPIFRYRALDREGNEITGTQQAQNKEELIFKLREKQLFLVKAESKGKKLFHLKKTSLTEITTFTRQLATLLTSGLALTEALSFLAYQFENKALGNTIAQIYQKVRAGQDFHQALSQHPKEFTPLYVNMVYAGEMSGSLEFILLRLTELFERQLNLLSRIKTILIYPTIMVFMGGGILIFLLTYIVPVVTEVFTQKQQVLPLPTIILIAISLWLKKYWLLLIIILGGGILFFHLMKKKEKFKKTIDGIKLRLPIFSSLSLNMNIANLSGTLSTLITGGIELTQALAITRNIVTNQIIADAISYWQNLLRKGVSITSSLKEIKVFPPLFKRMVSAGEKSGKLKEILSKTAEIYENEFVTMINRLLTILEAGIILLMGLIIGFIVLAILLPIFEMSQLIK